MNRTILALMTAAGLMAAGPVYAGSGPDSEIAPAPAMPVEMSVPGPLGPLRGTYLAPADGRPVFLIIPGSGPTDRDGNNPGGIASASYRLLAEGMADHGIGSLRIDKRGMFGSAGAVADGNQVTIGDYADDIGTWVRQLAADAGRPCVWLAGHSEGGLVALAAANSHADQLCGLVLLAAPGRPLGTLLREQIAANPANAPIMDEASTIIDRLEQGDSVPGDDMTPVLLTMFAPQVQGFLIDAMAQDPAALAGSTDLPLLIVQGDADLQVKPADADALAASRPDARVLVLEGVSHTLKRVTGDGVAANYATYLDPSLPLDPRVVPALAAFVTHEKEPG